MDRARCHAQVGWEGSYFLTEEAVGDPASQAGLTIGTPGFFINGRLVSGAQPLESFVQVVEDGLARAQ